MLHFLELACHGVHAAQCMQMLKVPFEAEQAGPWPSKLDQHLVAHSAMGDRESARPGPWIGHKHHQYGQMQQKFAGICNHICITYERRPTYLFPKWNICILCIMGHLLLLPTHNVFTPLNVQVRVSIHSGCTMLLDNSREVALDPCPTV
jgi:hypothetical protein